MEPFHPPRGFTLIELLVVLAIITVLMGVVLSSQSSFNKSLVLSNTAYDIALTLRSAETFGLSSRGSTGSTNAGYGLHFLNGVTGSFTLFYDLSPPPSSASCHGVPSVGGADAPDAKPGNCTYDGLSEKTTDYTLGNGIIISDFCAYTTGGSSCASSGLSSLDIVFARPNPNPFISAGGSYSALYNGACLKIVSPQDPLSPRFISIVASGQITANAASCP